MGANVNPFDSERNTPLIYSVQSKDTRNGYPAQGRRRCQTQEHPNINVLTSAMQTRANPLCIEPILGAGIDVNTKAWKVVSLLAYAVNTNSRDCVATLLRCGAAIQSSDNVGDTALMDSLFYNSDDAPEPLLAFWSGLHKNGQLRRSILSRTCHLRRLGDNQDCSRSQTERPGRSRYQ